MVSTGWSGSTEIVDYIQQCVVAPPGPVVFMPFCAPVVFSVSRQARLLAAAVKHAILYLLDDLQNA